MLKPLKLLHNQNHKIFFISDLHMGHDPSSWNIPLWKRRGYNSVIEHDMGIIKGWNDNVSHNAIVFHLGDIMFGHNGRERLGGLFDRVLNFEELYLMPGNHHAGYSQLYKKAYDINNGKIDEYGRLTVFVGDILDTENHNMVHFIPNYFEIIVSGRPIALSHYPILSWNGMGNTSWHLFGHVHNTLGSSEIGKKYMEGFCMDVGVESVDTPQSFDQIQKVMGNRKLNIVDHHGPNTQNPF